MQRGGKPVGEWEHIRIASPTKVIHKEILQNSDFEHKNI